MIDARLLALEVIATAARNFGAGFGPADRFDFDSVIADRWPGGAGGVGIAHGRTRVEVKRAIIEFYQPDEPNDDTSTRSTT